jgi:hypothetical protein
VDAEDDGASKETGEMFQSICGGGGLRDLMGRRL